MGSFQQVFMGLTCLAAAFFFGRYMHNRPAANEDPVSEIAVVDPIDSLFSMGRPQSNPSTQAANFAALPHPAQQDRNSATAPNFDNRPAATQKFPASNSLFAAKPTAAEINRPAASAEMLPKSDQGKSTVPDFSELASRFRNSPLQLDSNDANRNVLDPIHSSERVPSAGGLLNVKPPEMVVRQPGKMTPLEDFRRQVTRVETQAQAATREPVDPTTSAGRWRVNRSEAIDKFDPNRSVFEAATRQPASRLMQGRDQQTIEDVLSNRSADYLKDSSDPAVSSQRQQITERAAARNRLDSDRSDSARGDLMDRNLFEVTDPGNRFSSRQSMAPQSLYTPPQSILESSVAEPIAPPMPISASPQLDGFTRTRARGGMQSIQRNETGGWNRRSNIRTEFRNTYRIAPGDTLQSISTRVYGSPVHYLELYKANRNVLDRIDSVPEGVEIVIPRIDAAK